jgi:hypothetical protein
MSSSPIPAAANASIASRKKRHIATTLKGTTLDFEGMMGRNLSQLKMGLYPRTSSDRAASPSMLSQRQGVWSKLGKTFL